MSKYNNNRGPLTYDLGYLMRQLGIKVNAERNGQEYHYQPPETVPAADQPAKSPQFVPEPEITDISAALNTSKYASDNSLRQVLEGLKRY